MKTLFLAIVLAAATTWGQVPLTVGYQGRLLDATGSPQAGIVKIQFALFDADKAGNEVWCEEHLAAVTEGYYAVNLGSGGACNPPLASALSSAFEGSDRFLEISIAGSPLSPRQKVASVPFAFEAASLAGAVSFAGTAPFQGAGTIDTAQDSRVVVGHNTAFGTEVVVGDLIAANGQARHVASISSASSLIVDTNFTANNNGYKYQVQKAVAQFRTHQSGTSPESAALIIDEKGRVGVRASPVSSLHVHDDGQFDPGVISSPRNLALGYAKSQDARWYGTGLCATGDSDAGVCMVTNGGTWYWGAQNSASSIANTMFLSSAGELWIAATLTQSSTRAAKKDIAYLDAPGLARALQYVLDTPVATFRYKAATPDSKPNWGVIAETTPTPLLGDDEKSVNLSNTVGILLAAVKAQQQAIGTQKARLDAQDARIAQLEAQIGRLVGSK